LPRPKRVAIHRARPLEARGSRGRVRPGAHCGRLPHTNKLPGALERPKLDEDRVRQQNPRILYARGSAFGPKGPDRDKGGYDGTAFWCRGGSADAATLPGGAVAPQPTPAYGDSISAMTIAGGIAAALFRRERTGAAGSIDVSLLATGRGDRPLAPAGAALAVGVDDLGRPGQSAGLALPDERRSAPLPGHAPELRLLACRSATIAAVRHDTARMPVSRGPRS
jgi:hypothetical protein